MKLETVFGNDNSIVSGARVSYLGESKGGQQDKRLLFYLYKNKHASPFEQAEIHFQSDRNELDWVELLSDSRYQFRVLDNGKSLKCAIDINNAIKMVLHSRNPLIKVFLGSMMKQYFPWVFMAMEEYSQFSLDNQIEFENGECVPDSDIDLNKKIQVLDKGYIQLIDFYGSDRYVSDLEGWRTGMKKQAFYLLKNDLLNAYHLPVVKFLVYAPVVTYWQWVRHRKASYNFQSGRYTPFQENDFYSPIQWRLQASDNKQMSDGVLSDNRMIERLNTQLSTIYETGFHNYDEAINGRKYHIAREQARLFLPGWSLYYKSIIKMDMVGLINFLRLRMHEHAQEEIRVYADAVAELVEPLYPKTIKYIRKEVE